MEEALTYPKGFNNNSSLKNKFFNLFFNSLPQKLAWLLVISCAIWSHLHVHTHTHTHNDSLWNTGYAISNQELLWSDYSSFNGIHRLVSDLRLVRLFDFAENTLDLRYLVGLPDKILGRKSHWEGLSEEYEKNFGMWLKVFHICFQTF